MNIKARLYLVNPKAGEILGLPVHSSIDSLPEKPDLAVIILPAAICPQALRDCAAKGIKHVVISAGGFAEVDDSGAQTQQELIEIIREYDIRIIGPNTAGHTSTPHNFTSTFFPLGRIRRGTGFLSYPNRKLLHAHNEIYSYGRAFWSFAGHWPGKRHRCRRKRGPRISVVQIPKQTQLSFTSKALNGRGDFLRQPEP